MSSSQDSNTSTNSSGPSLERAGAEAAEEYLPKAAQINLAERAVWLKDLAQLAEFNRTNTQRFMEKTALKGAPPTPPGSDMGDIVVCDNYDRSFHSGNSAEKSAANSPGSEASAGTSEAKQKKTWAQTLAPYLIGAGLTVPSAVGTTYMLSQSATPQKVEEPAALPPKAESPLSSDESGRPVPPINVTVEGRRYETEKWIPPLESPRE